MATRPLDLSQERRKGRERRGGRRRGGAGWHGDREAGGPGNGHFRKEWEDKRKAGRRERGSAVIVKLQPSVPGTSTSLVRGWGGGGC